MLPCYSTCCLCFFFPYDSANAYYQVHIVKKGRASHFDTCRQRLHEDEVIPKVHICLLCILKLALFFPLTQRKQVDRLAADQAAGRRQGSLWKDVQANGLRQGRGRLLLGKAPNMFDFEEDDDNDEMEEEGGWISDEAFDMPRETHHARADRKRKFKEGLAREEALRESRVGVETPGEWRGVRRNANLARAKELERRKTKGEEEKRRKKAKHTLSLSLALALAPAPVPVPEHVPLHTGRRGTIWA